MRSYSRKGTLAPIKMGVYIIYSFMIMIAIFTFTTTLLQATSSVNAVSEDAEHHIIISRVFSSHHCLAYQDSTGRVYDMIDITRFDNKTLENCIELSSYGIDMRFTLDYPGSEEEYVAETRDWFGNTFDEAYDLPVIVRNSSEIFPGELQVEIQTTHSE